MVNQCIIIDIHQQSFFKPWQSCDPFIEKSTIPDATPTTKNLKDEINENTAINVQPLHPKTGERQQQLQSFASTLKKSKIYLT